MNPTAHSPRKARPVFPDSDGKPMADNTLQFEWISTLKWNLEHLFADRDDVFVAGDNLIYPVDDDPAVCQAPDVYVAFDRPKGYRGSYKVWEEGGIFPQVVFEVWSPGNTVAELDEKRTFYAQYGAEEFYLLFPEFPVFAQGWVRRDGLLQRTLETNGFVSPRLGIRIQFFPRELNVYGPDGRRFVNPAQVAAARDAAEARESLQRQRADRQQQQAELERQRADEQARQKEAERQRAEAERQRAEKLAAKLRELGVDPDAV